MRRSSILSMLLAAVAVLAVLAVGIWAGGHPDRLPEPIRDALVDDRESRLVEEAIDEISAEYYREVGRDELVDEALAGMVDSLDDRFSHYFTPKQFAEYMRASNSEFAGIGVEVTPREGEGLRIVHVYDDAPAEKAGLKPGDTIVAVEGRSIRKVSMDTAVARIQGEPGTDVRLSIDRGKGDPFERTLTRDVISVPVVDSRMRRTDDGTKVAHVALARFSSGAHGELRQEIDRRLEQGAEAILLDLRHNGGGLLEEARLVSSVFIDEGEVVTIKGRNQPTKTLDATGGAIDADIPVAVLVDRGTASAAEIVSGAIQDRDRGEVIGTRTYGKGVFQQVIQLSNGGALDITVGQYFTPDGTNLGGGGVERGAGIKPDVRAPDDQDTPRRDETVQAGLDALAGELSR